MASLCMSRRRPVAKQEKEDRLYPTETRERLGRWLLENVDDLKLPKPKSYFDNFPFTASASSKADGAKPRLRSNVFTEEQLAASAEGPPEQRDTPGIFAFRHMVESSKPGHDRARCKTCAACEVISQLQIHALESSPWDEAVPFLKEIDDVIRRLQSLAEAASRRRERLIAHANSRAKSSNFSKMLGPNPQLVIWGNAFDRLDRLLHFTRIELQRTLEEQLAEFSSPDHAALARANPPQPLIKNITKRLSQSGFTTEEIARLVVDRPATDDPEKVKDAFRAAVGRVRKRLTEPSTVESSSSREPSKPRGRRSE